MTPADAQRNVQKNTKNNLNWGDQNQDIDNIYSLKKQQE